MFIKGDFHLHTTASDGKLTPTELLNLAKSENIDILSVTDHDTVSGIEEAINSGTALGIKVVPGIELSTFLNGESIHILGYFRDDTYKLKNFEYILKEFREYRLVRAQKIVDNLQNFFNIKLSYENMLKNAKGVVARPHIAKAIQDAGYSYSWDYIFKNLIGEESPAYVPKKQLNLSEGIELLKSLNAVVVLAHPVLIKKTDVEELLSFNFDGIEAIYHSNTQEDTERFINLAKKHDKLITAGSDFHGIGVGDNGHGYVGSVQLSSKNIEIFLRELNR